tara:strand:+ start:156 stop:944 length:789 start_codon:yes stop_codon:yes gene_type:complete
MSEIDIIRCPHDGQTLNWLSGDSEKEWNKNRKRLGEEWPYYDIDDIEYNHNDYGYRAKEFANYRWSESVLFFGCSHVYGKGNKLENTIPALYSKLTDCETINMGIPGGGIETIHHNTHALIEKKYIPKKVVIIWPSINRHLVYTGKDFNSGQSPKNIGGWTTDKFRHAWMQYISYPENYITKSYLLQKSIIKVWQLEGVQVHHFNISVNSKNGDPSYKRSNYFDLQSAQLPEPIDRARDISHYGVKTNKTYAEYICNRTDPI